MRRDMFKVIVERPRVDAKYDHPKGRHKAKPIREDDAAPRKSPMRPRGHRTKNLNENLAPLYRFLQSNVGRPWNKVFSEICENLCVDSIVQKHVRDHIPDFVTIQVVLDEHGEPRSKEATWRSKYLGEIRTDFWVHPRNGLLRSYKRVSFDQKQRQLREKRKQEKWAVERNLGPELILYKINGIWFQAVFSDRPGPYVYHGIDEDGAEYTYERTRPCYDAITGGMVPSTDKRYCSGKRQLSSKELKHYGVEND